MRQTTAAILLVLLIPGAALAQTAAPPPAVQFDQVLSANPLGVVIKWFNVEYERKLGPATTLGASASHVGELDFSNAAVLLRWYPQQSPLEGFYLGARAGAFGFKSYTYEFRSYREQNRVLPGAGIELGRNWLLGPRRNVSVGTGFGLTRIAGSDAYAVPSVLPIFRLNVGIAF